MKNEDKLDKEHPREEDGTRGFPVPRPEGPIYVRDGEDERGDQGGDPKPKEED